VDEGEAGVVILRTRTIHTEDGPRYSEATIRYPMVSRLVHVGPPAAATSPAEVEPAEPAEPEPVEPAPEPAAEPAPPAP
jgi:hypothetical protein